MGMKATGFLIGLKGFSEVVGRVASFLTAILAARLLAQTDFGLFSLAWAAGWIVAGVSDFGLQLYLAREVARKPQRAAFLFERLFRLRLLWSGALLATASIGCWMLGWPSQPIPFLLLIAAQILVSLVEFINHFFRGLSRSELESIIGLAYRLLLFAGSLAALWLTGSLMWLAAVQTAVALAALCATWRTARRIASESSIDGSQARNEVPDWKGIAWETAPIGAGIVLSSLYFRIDLFLIERWIDVASVAAYAAVFRLAEGFRLLPAAVMAVLFPRMCADRSLQTSIRVGAGLVACGSTLAAAAIWKSQELIGLAYDERFGEAQAAFAILLASLPLQFLNFALTHQLTAWGLQRFYAWLCLAGLLLNLSANAILIPRLQLEGAAWATLATEILLTFGCILVLAARRAERGQGKDADGAVQ